MNRSRFKNFFAAVALMVAAPAAMGAAAAAQETATAEKIIAGGVWQKKSFDASGEWSIVERDGRRIVVLPATFRTKSAPDLKIFLSPKAPADLNGRNATEGSTLIAPLRSNSGAQEYEIAASVDLSAFKSIIIHCEAYSKLWSVAPL